jgi:hypothetical protein
VPFSNEALQANLLRLEDEWDSCQSARDRDAIYGYLNAVFELVSWWHHEQKAIAYAKRALRLRGHGINVKNPEPFAAVILCTADPAKADFRTRSKWSRGLRYAAEFKDHSESLSAFIKRKGGINKCAERFTRRLGERGI